MKITIESRYDNKVMFEGESDSLKEGLIAAVKSGANLRGANLRGANLGDANLRGANLGGANLGDAKNYSESHDFFTAVVANQKPSTFTPAEWAAIGQIVVLKICWTAIVKRHKNAAMRVFKKLDNVGFGEWLARFKEEMF